MGPFHELEKTDPEAASEGRATAAVDLYVFSPLARALNSSGVVDITAANCQFCCCPEDSEQ
jgi:hypothetical protein